MTWYVVEAVKSASAFAKHMIIHARFYETVALELARKNALFPVSTHPEVKLYGSKNMHLQKV